MASALPVFPAKDRVHLFTGGNAAFDRCLQNPVTPIIVLANRAPFRYEQGDDGHLRVQRSASGLVTAVEPIVEACAGLWVAHGDGNAEMLSVGPQDFSDVRPATPRYRLRHVALTDAEHRGFYCGFANEGLWPLCHAVHVKPTFRTDDFRMYRIANERFANVAIEEARGRAPLVLVQDYHFALAPRVLRDRLPASTVATFWHIPWPPPRVFAICPWRQELLDGLLASDIVGVQTAEDRANFLETVESCLDASVDRTQGVVCYRDRSTHVRAYPVGIKWDNEFVQTTPNRAACREHLWRAWELGDDVRLGVGIDRLDYTKGIHEKFLAVERLLDTQPELRGRFVFLQVAEPSRSGLASYRAARAELVETSRRINGRYATEGYRPIILLERHHEPGDVYRLYRAADLCYVGSLHDGMNLVAKEFVCARDDERGVLVLSQFAGASRQLSAALMVNPYAIDGSADALARALTMSDAEQVARMRCLRRVVATTDTYWWADRLLGDSQRLSVGTSRLTRNGSTDLIGRSPTSSERSAHADSDLGSRRVAGAWRVSSRPNRGRRVDDADPEIHHELQQR
jgi:trehalose 6-phosphate synthase